MNRSINLCTSTLPTRTLPECAELAVNAGYQGLELRVHDAFHTSLAQLLSDGASIRRSIEARRLELAVYNPYYGITEDTAIDALIGVCRRTGVRHFRVTLPMAGAADVKMQGLEGAVVPSYEQRARPSEVLRSLKESLQKLARRTRAAGVCALVEMHWGTVMSSFTSAHYLVGNLDPADVAITFDPANMIVEGREDWCYGIQLLRGHVANVHIKNVAWQRDGVRWQWRWDELLEGMVDWPEIFRLLAEAGYGGMFAMEDFRVPRDCQDALRHLRSLRSQTRLLLQRTEAGQAA